MELEELQKLLNSAVTRNSAQFAELSVNTKRQGVFSDIKRRLKWIFLIFACTTLIFAPFFFSHHNSGLTFLLLYFILSIEFFISFIAFIEIHAIERTQENITKNLVRRIHHLKSIFRSYIFLNLFLYILLAVLVEYGIYDHRYPPFALLATVPLFVRFMIYLLFIYFQYAIKRRSFDKNYGAYLNNMINILEQTR